MYRRNLKEGKERSGEQIKGGIEEGRGGGEEGWKKGVEVLIFLPFVHPDSDVLSALGVAIATYLSLYPVVLIFPFLLMSHKVSTTVSHALPS